MTDPDGQAIGSPKENDFAASMERAGNAAFDFADGYMKKMMALMDREIGSTPEPAENELLDYAKVRHDPQTLRQAFLEPLRARLGKGKGNEEFVRWVQAMEKKLMPRNQGY